MNILFLGQFIPPKLLKTVVEDSKGKIGFSNHNFEISIIEGLKQQQGVSLKILTAPKVYSYPYNNTKFYTPHENYLSDNVPIYSIGFCNLPIINKLSILFGILFRLILTFNKYQGNTINVIVNTPNVFIETALLIAQRFTNKKITKTLIIPDIPQFVTSMDQQNPIKKNIIKWLDQFAMSVANKFDYYVFLTETMTDFFPQRRLKYIVMEGIINIKNERLTLPSNEPDHEIILYTGTLRKIFGIIELVKIFDLGKFPNTELWICGSGEAKAELELWAQKNPRIKFWGLVSSEKARELQMQATILANPRSRKGEYTKYSFPSKTIEYLLSGKNVIMNKLPGVPQDYYQYVYAPNNESIDAWIQTINQILSAKKNNRKERAQLGREFILKNKNAATQCARILNLIEQNS